jgi:hypothetical protein
MSVAVISESTSLVGCEAVDEFFRSPGCGIVYNIGGGRRSNCSMPEAIGWRQAYEAPSILSEIYECNADRWLRTAACAFSVPVAAWQSPVPGKSVKPNA